MTGIDAPLTGAELTHALSSTLVKSRRVATGHGPGRAQVFYRSNVVVVVMQDAMTRAEHRLDAQGKRSLVLAMRGELHESLHDELVADVARLTGRNVTARLTSAHLKPDISAELYVLDGPVAGEDALPLYGI